MSNYFNRPNPLGLAVSAVKKIFKSRGKNPTPGTAINTTNISKNLKEFKKHKEDIIKSTDKHGKGLTEKGKIKVKTTVAPALSKLSKLTQKLPEKKAKGGRVGLKRGTGLRKPSNVEKIKKAFGPKQKPQTRMTKKKKKFPDLTGDGKVTFADILKGRGVINGKKKKKVI